MTTAKRIGKVVVIAMIGATLAFVLNGNYRSNNAEWCWHMNGISVCSNPGIRAEW